jgi:hypothetical protein
VRLARAAEVERAVLLLATPYRVSGFAAGAVVKMDDARFAWLGGGAAPRLLAGVDARLTLDRDRERRGSARGGATLSLHVADAISRRRSSSDPSELAFHPPVSALA